MSRHVKMIQNALLYNKIECYNTGVQKKSLSLRGCTHSLKSHMIPSTGCFEGRQTRIGHCGDDRSRLHCDARLNIERALVD